MLTKIIINIYRIFACLMIISPIVINFLLNGGIVVSFFYIPLLCIFLSVFSIYVDKKLLNILDNIALAEKEPNEEKQPESIPPLY